MWTSAFEIRITYGNLTKNYNLNIVVYALYDYSLFHVLPGSSNFLCQIAVANYLLYSRSTYWIIVWRNKQVSYKIFFGWKLFLFSVFILHTVVYIILQFFQTKLPKQQQENNSCYSISIIWRPKTYPPNIYVYISEQNIDLTPKNTLLKSHVKVN